MTLVEKNPTTMVALDLQKGKVTAGDLTIDVTLPPAARESFLDGTWDATGLLLDRYEAVEAVAAKLPYVSGWR
jgi:3-isopropylmalate/(R)-2-methylmalate dehydratase small subunit